MRTKKECLYSWQVLTRNEMEEVLFACNPCMPSMDPPKNPPIWMKSAIPEPKS